MKIPICVIGAGAIGGVTASFLAKAGWPVTLVTKHDEVTALANADGLKITGVRGAETVRVPAVTDIEDVTGTYRLCLIATKAYDLQDCARRVLPRLAEDALVVSMQNGICTDALAGVVGARRTVGCVIGFGATLHAPGAMEMTSTGEFVIGMPDRSLPPLLETLREALEAVAPTRVSDDIYAELYSKLIVNACITALGAVCGLRLGEMMRRSDARRIFLGIIDEGVQVANAMKLVIPPYGGKLDYHRLMSGRGPADHLRRHLTIRVVGLKYRRLKSSSLQSLERGRMTEIQYFNGYIARKGAECGVRCPINERLTAMVGEIERRERPIDVSNLADPALTEAVAALNL